MKEDNQAVIKALNMYGRVPETWELLEEIERLNKKIEQYENPEDMTLMYMWCDEKAKDEIKRLNSIINELEKLLYKIERDTEMDIRYARSKNDDEEVIRLNRDFNMCDMILDKLEELKGANKK